MNNKVIVIFLSSLLAACATAQLDMAVNGENTAWEKAFSAANKVCALYGNIDSGIPKKTARKFADCAAPVIEKEVLGHVIFPDLAKQRIVKSKRILKRYGNNEISEEKMQDLIEDETMKYSQIVNEKLSVLYQQAAYQDQVERDNIAENLRRQAEVNAENNRRMMESLNAQQNIMRSKNIHCTTYALGNQINTDCR